MRGNARRCLIQKCLAEYNGLTNEGDLQIVYKFSQNSIESLHSLGAFNEGKRTSKGRECGAKGGTQNVLCWIA